MLNNSQDSKKHSTTVNDWPKISIVTPSFNQGQFLEQTILSVLNQNYPNIEYIIIDGGSTDNSVEIIKKYEKQLTYWVSEKDKGQSDAINKGLTKVTGEIFNWLNSDDYYSPNALHTIAQTFIKSKSDVVCGQCTIFGNTYSYTALASTFFDVQKNVVVNPRINQPATFFKMDIVKKLGQLNVDLHFCMDLEWWMKYLFTYGNKNISIIPEVLVNFREHENSKTVSKSTRFIEDNCLLYGGIIAAKKKTENPFGNYKFCAPLEKVPFEFIDKLAATIFFMGAVVFYGKMDKSKVKLLLSNINPEFLSFRDKKIVDKMKFRIKYIPWWVYKLKR